MFWLRALILATALILGAGGASAMGVDREFPVNTTTAEAEEIPAGWSPLLGLKNLDDIERRLEEPLWNEVGIPMARR